MAFMQILSFLGSGGAQARQAAARAFRSLNRSQAPASPLNPGARLAPQRGSRARWICGTFAVAATSAAVASADGAPENLSKEVATDGGRWIKMMKIKWVDRKGRLRSWESCERTTRRGDVDGVGIVAIIREADPKDDKVILVSQYRPALGRLCIEVPAGLIDANETAADAAVRELREETGFEGRVLSVSSPMSNDPGLTNANCQLVTLEVPPLAPGAVRPVQELEDGEDIEVILAPLDGLLDFLHKLERERGAAIDARLYAFAFGLCSAGSILRPPP
eukprot:tig00021072_g17991.t1